MFLTLLIVTFVVAFTVSSIVVLIFARPIKRILERIIADKISSAWSKYIIFALYATGVSSGVRVWDLEKYITQRDFEGAKIVELTTERWILELYRTVISTLQGAAWMLLVFFIFTLVAYVIVRAVELKSRARELEQEKSH